MHIDLFLCIEKKIFILSMSAAQNFGLYDVIEDHFSTFKDKNYSPYQHGPGRLKLNITYYSI